MYGIPENIDIDFFVGYYLTKIGIGVATFTLHLEPKHALAGSKQSERGMLVASSFAYVINGESSTGHAGQPASVAPLVAFLSDDIIEMYRIGKGNLLLRFRKGGEITINEDESEYESYTIYLGEGDMIVV